MGVRYFCDRCGETFASNEILNLRGIDVSFTVPASDGTEKTFVDLCPDCMEKLRQFFKDGVKDNA